MTSFYSTYEELKPVDSCSAANFYVIRFYSTYEELKHLFPVEGNNSNSIVFTVPMRNWNISTSSP